MSVKKIKRLIIIGAGGHGKAVAEAAQLMGSWEQIVFIDDSLPLQVEVWPGQPIIGRVDDVQALLRVGDQCLVAIGNQSTRKKILDQLSAQNANLATVVHPRAWVSAEAKVADGVAIMAGAIVGTNASVGRGVIVNANATIDHDVVLEDYVHIGVGVQLAGGVIVRSGAWLQAGVCAGYRVVVAKQSVVMPGTALKEV